MLNILTTEKENSNPESLTGKFLIASPFCMPNDVFNKSLIYVMSHNESGAVGLIINRIVQKLTAGAILKLFKDNDSSDSPLSVSLYAGGPVEPERGFVLHTPEYNKNLLIKSSDGLAVSSNIEIIRDIAQGQGPQNSMVVVGYTGWGPGQLEEEITQNMWIVSESSNDIIFSENVDKWEIALSKIGIDNTSFASQAGHC